MSAGRPRVWRAPIALNLLAAAGLVVGLLGDGGWDWIAVAALAAPLAAGLRYAFFPRA